MAFGLMTLRSLGSSLCSYRLSAISGSFRVAGSLLDAGGCGLGLRSSLLSFARGGFSSRRSLIGALRSVLGALCRIGLTRRASR
jgi:hypothetical protein